MAPAVGRGVAVGAALGLSAAGLVSVLGAWAARCVAAKSERAPRAKRLFMAILRFRVSCFVFGVSCFVFGVWGAEYGVLSTAVDVVCLIAFGELVPGARERRVSARSCLTTWKVFSSL